MDFLLTDEQKELRELVREFGENEVAPVAAEYDEKGEMPMEVYKKAFDMGLHAIGIPEEFGGAGLDSLSETLVQEELARHDPGFATSVGAITLALKPVLIAGNDEQKKLVTDIVVPGAFAAFCLTEPNAGSDAGATKTKAKKDGDEYVINGTKCFITNGGVADVYVVIASTDRKKKAKGLSAFIVEGDREGISVGKEENKMGIRTSNTTEVIFEDVRVPADHLIGKEGDGFKIAMKTLDASRAGVGAAAVGICQAAVDHAKKYAIQRNTFGRPIAAHQAIYFKLADMEMKTDLARQYCRYVAQLYDAGHPITEASSIAKCFASDAAMEITVEAIQILGGYGYSKEYPVEKLMRDAKIYQIYEGTNEIQRMVIASQIFREFM